MLIKRCSYLKKSKINVVVIDLAKFNEVFPIHKPKGIYNG